MGNAALDDRFIPTGYKQNLLSVSKRCKTTVMVCDESKERRKVLGRGSYEHR